MLDAISRQCTIAQRPEVRDEMKQVQIKDRMVRYGGGPKAMISYHVLIGAFSQEG